jgi:hypothetical protein
MQFHQRIEYKWRWSLDKNFRASFLSEDAPCWFYRLMQRAVLGIYWKRLGGNDKRR